MRIESGGDMNLDSIAKQMFLQVMKLFRDIQI